MKKFLIVFFLLFFGITSLTYCQISGTKHDFSIATWNSGEDRICVFCHTPHNGSTVTNAPLWNHQTTVQSYTLYNSPTFDATALDPDASSKLCLSCHDGTVAVENFGGVTTGSLNLSGSSQIGGSSHDLSTEHPISFLYNTALATADGGLHDPSSVTTSLGGTIDDDLLFDGKMQCSSCHDVHNQYGVAKLLVMSNTASQLCLTCHNK